MNRPLIIGVGNRYRGDDSVGLDVAERVSRKVIGEVDIAYCDGDPIRLLDVWGGRECVYIIDAVTSGSKEVGHIYLLDISINPVPALFNNTSTHFLDVIQVVELARALKRLPKQVFLYGIEASHYCMDETMSENLTNLLPKIVEEIENDIQKKLNRCRDA